MHTHSHGSTGYSRRLRSQRAHRTSDSTTSPLSPLLAHTESDNNYFSTSQNMSSIHNRRDATSEPPNDRTHTPSNHHHHHHRHHHPLNLSKTRTLPESILHHRHISDDAGMATKDDSSEPHYDIYAGAEPGVNPRSGLARAEYGHFKERCVIDIIDYDAEDVEFRRVSNKGMLDFLSGKYYKNREGEEIQKGHGSKDGKENDEREGTPEDIPGDKQSLPRNVKVRWINIGGIDWEVLSLLAIRYNLHSLALEDILHERGHNQSKVDYYQNNIFIRILCNSLQRNTRGEDAEPTSIHVVSPERPSTYNTAPDLRSNLLTHEEMPSKERLNDDWISSAKKNGKSKLLTAFHLQDSMHFPLKKRLGKLSGYRSKARDRQIVKLRALTEGDRIEVIQEPVFIFLLRNGTVISIHPTPNLEYTNPISERLIHLHDSVLRTSEDASLLVQSLLDLVVDRGLEMVDEYQIKISDLEHQILLGPSMQSVRSLHILSGDLIHHKRSLEPIKTLIYNLRRYDEERAMAVADHGHSVPPPTRPGTPTHNSDSSRERGAPSEVQSGDNKSSLRPPVVVRSSSGDVVGAYEKQMKPKGYFSPKAKVYLADVYDHIDFALSSLDMFEDISENLINFAFNTASYEMNVVMNRLTFVTIIFLPLTLLTGYFGMNFKPFWSVDNNSDLFFWKLAVPIMVALVPLFMHGDIVRMYDKLRRRWSVRYALKASEALQKS